MQTPTIPIKQEPFTRVNDSIILIHQDSMKNMNFNSCNCYVVKIEDEDFAVIDPGCSKRKFVKALRSNKIAFNNIKYVYLTHGHSDHYSILDFLLEKNPNIEVYIHELDKKLVEDSRTYFETLFNLDLLGNNAKYIEFLNAVDYYSGYKPNQEINPYFKTIFDVWNVKDRIVHHMLKDGEMLPGFLEVIHVPGHTNGMCFFYHHIYEILFSADIHLSPIGASMAGINLDIRLFKTSTHLLADLIDNKPVVSILSGHGKNPIDSDLHSRVTRFYNSITEKEYQIKEILKNTSGLSLKQITKETFKKFLKRIKRFSENQAFKDTIVIAEVLELNTNLNLLKELERLDLVYQEEHGEETLWTLK